MKECQVEYGEHEISFSLERKARKSLKIDVLPNLTVVVIAPVNVPLKDICEKVRKRASWILKQQEYFKGFLPKDPPRKYISGETHRYMGRQYRLKILPAERNEVKLKGAYITIWSRERDNPDHNKRLLYKWYREHAERKYSEIIAACLERLRRYGVRNPIVEIKIMKSRWGSCVSEKGKILLNTELIKAPSHGIEYVIMHELCHLKFPNHDKRFYELLGLIMPDWRERKERLEIVFP